MWDWFRGPRKVLERNELRKLLFRAFSGWSRPVLDREYCLFRDREDFLRVCPRPKKWEVDYDCNRQVAEVLGQLQGYAIGGVVVDWDCDGGRHCLLVVVFEGGVLRVFDVNSRKFYAPDRMIVRLLWI